MKITATCLTLAAIFAVSLAAQQPPAAGGSGRGGRGTPVAELVGDARAGQTYFNGEGKCNTCHSPTGDLKGVAGKWGVTELQSRIVYPRGTSNRSATRMEAPQDPPLTVTVTPASGPAATGTLLNVSDYVVVLKDSSGVRHSYARNGDSPKVVIKDPLQAHIDMLPKWTDANIHNLTAYLVTLK